MTPSEKRRRQQPAVKARRAAYDARPDVRARRAAYYRSAEQRDKRNATARARRAAIMALRKAHLALAFAGPDPDPTAPMP